MCLAGQSQRLMAKDMAPLTFMVDPKPCLNPRAHQCHSTEHGCAHPHHQLHQPGLDQLQLQGL